MKVYVPSQDLFLLHKGKVSWLQIVPGLVREYCQLARQFALAWAGAATAWVFLERAFRRFAL